MPLSARELHNDYVTPDHLLLAQLGARNGVAASIAARHRRACDSWVAGAVELLSAHQRRATGIVSDPARRLVAEDVLWVAHRLGQRALGTGHLFLALIESSGSTDLILRELGDLNRLRAEITGALPGDEHT